MNDQATPAGPVQSPRDTVTLLALWSRLELLRASGAGVGPLRDRVRAALQASGFDPLDPLGTQSATAAAADLQADIAQAIAKAEAEEAAAQARLEVIAKEIPEVEIPDPPMDVPRAVDPEALQKAAEALATGPTAAGIESLISAIGQQASDAEAAFHQLAAEHGLQAASDAHDSEAAAVGEKAGMHAGATGDSSGSPADGQVPEPPTPDGLAQQIERMEKQEAEASAAFNKLAEQIPQGPLPEPPWGSEVPRATD